jgi:hypothetical protein
VAREPLPLDAPGHIASHSSSAGLVAPAAAEEMAALRCPQSFPIYLNMCEISFISDYVYILK